MIYNITTKNFDLSDKTLKDIDKYAKKLVKYLPDFDPDLLLMDFIIRKQKKHLDNFVEKVEANHTSTTVYVNKKTYASVYYDGRILLRLPAKPLVVRFKEDTVDKAISVGFERIDKELQRYEGMHFVSDSEYYNHQSIRREPEISIPKSTLVKVIDSPKRHKEEKAAFKKEREELADNYIRPAVNDPRIVEAFLSVPRHNFVSHLYWNNVYFDIPLPIGENQTTTTPSLIASMIELLDLKGNEKVLEIGTGTGYQAALLSSLAKEVYTLERLRKLAKTARKNLKRYKNVHVFTEDGFKGLPKYAPYDAIIVTAAIPQIPERLQEQLKEGGRIVIPLQDKNGYQSLNVGIKQNGKINLEKKLPVRFVPLLKKIR